MMDPLPRYLGLSGEHDPIESCYAYQLMEGTEILLRESLLMLLENRGLFDIFVDPNRLDGHF